MIGLIALVSVLLIAVIANLVVEKHKEQEKLLLAQNLKDEIDNENKIIPSLGMEFISFGWDNRYSINDIENRTYLENDTYIFYYQFRFEIKFSVDSMLFHHLDEESKVKFNVINHIYNDSYTPVSIANSYEEDGKYVVTYTGNFDYKSQKEEKINLYVEEFIYNYKLREYHKEEIKTNIFNKKMDIQNVSNSIYAIFKNWQYITVNINFYNCPLNYLYVRTWNTSNRCN